MSSEQCLKISNPERLYLLRLVKKELSQTDKRLTESALIHLFSLESKLKKRAKNER